jgi:phosphate-selective porin OprO/OprP
VKTLSKCPVVLWLGLLLAIHGSGGAQPRQSQSDSSNAALLRRIEELERQVRELQEKLGAGPAGAPEEKPKEGNEFTAKWKDSLRLETADGRVKLRIGGRIHHDVGWFSVHNDSEAAFATADDSVDGTEFRRARLYISGELYDRYEFKAQYDFAGGDADFKDVYVGCKNLPGIGGIRLGQFKEPFGLEELTSSNDITFMERSLANAFVPSRDTGLMLHNAELGDRLTWAAGVFRDTDSYGDGSADGHYNFTARVTGLPCYRDKDRLVHVGLGYSHRNPVNDEARFSERPEAHLAPRLVDTGTFEATSLDLLGAELAVLRGPASLQAEYIRASASVPGGPDPDFDGYYVTGSYLLFGGHRSYKASAGTFGGVAPETNVLENGGRGALELAARYSRIDLRDAGIDGGQLSDLTLGANWYLNPNARLMGNVVFANPDGSDDATIFQMRSQFSF